MTVANHARVESTFEQALKDQRIEYASLFITLTIFNNVLNAVVDAGDEFLLAQYSIYDEVAPSFHAIPKGYECAQPRHRRDARRASLVQCGLLQRGA